MVHKWPQLPKVGSSAFGIRWNFTLLRELWAVHLWSSNIIWLKIENFLAMRWKYLCLELKIWAQLKKFWVHLLAKKFHGLLPSPSLCDFLVIRSRSLKKGILALLRVVSINDTERQELHINFVSLYNFYFQLTVSCLLFRIIRKEEASIDNILQFSWQCF